MSHVSVDDAHWEPGENGVVPIHTLWIGEVLGPIERLCLISWVRLGYEVVLHSYADLQVPAGVKTVDASLLLSADKIFRNERNGSLAVFSDVYRALILKRFFAIWLDIDIFLVRRFDFSAPNILAMEGGDRHENINNALMKLSPDHPILDEILGRYEAPFKAISWRTRGKKWQMIVKAILSRGLHPRHLPWGALGCHAIRHQIAQNGFSGRIISPDYGLTAHRMPLFEPVEDADSGLTEPVFYVHLYRSQMVADPLKPAPGSVYARLLEIAGVTVQDLAGSTWM